VVFSAVSESIPRSKKYLVYDLVGTSHFGSTRGSAIAAAIAAEGAASKAGMGSMAVGASPRFAALVRGKLPGALLDTEDMSVSTLRQYERNGWIRRSGAKDPRSWAYVTLTRDGYSAGN
jgi:hypothetical protein